MALPKTDGFSNGGSTQDITAYNANYYVFRDNTKVPRVVSNELAQDAGASTCFVLWKGDSFTDNQMVEATIRHSQAYGILLLGCDGQAGAGTCQGYWWDLWSQLAGYFTAGGALVTLASGITQPSIDDVIRFWKTGGSNPTLHGSYNGGSDVINFNDSGNNGGSGGYPGLGLDGPNGIAWDDVTFDNYPPTGGGGGGPAYLAFPRWNSSRR